MKQYGWLIYSKKDALENKSYINWFIEEAGLQNISLKLIIREELAIGITNNQRTISYHSEPVNLPNFAVIRTIDPILSLHFESCGILVFNSSGISALCNNKALSHHYVHDLGIPMVDTLFIKKENLPVSPPFAYPFVVKEVTGRGGQQVYFIKQKLEWENCLSVISSSQIIVQTSNVRLGQDVRVFIVGREIVGAVKRSSSTDFRANYKLGGSAEWYQPSGKEMDIINRIVTNFDFDMVGIDFLIGKDGHFLFNELEDVVGSRTLSAVSDVNILKKYTTHIKRKLSIKNA
ncbi:ATP-grasp domain-containing protein [Virgibacillus oceani]|uniref:ATP-grasp domain-containing protein n=1 Tax=Virgibacillus oceani TaxID=1479511 RepID=A0A917LW44_9BACI|nr:hypothetical protein [Virgibacillus oceani]GGG62412.1 hypothetical protein GCM10011398_02210 [Virgibacillus oceani]